MYWRRFWSVVMERDGGPLRHSIRNAPSASISEKSETGRISVVTWPLPMMPPTWQPARAKTKPANKAIVVLFMIVLLLVRRDGRPVWIQQFCAYQSIAFTLKLFGTNHFPGLRGFGASIS